MNGETRSNQGYEIIESCTIGNTELVIGHHPKQCRQLKPTLPPYVLQIYPYVKPIRCSVMSRYPFEVPVWTND
jgi:hypothetical protein